MSTFPLRVLKKRTETPEAVSIWLDVPRDLNHAFDYRAGQFIAIETDIGGETLLRQYSLSSAPGQDRELRITVKKVDRGRVSSWLVDSVEAGDVLEVAPPRGIFFKPLEEPHHVLLLAVGSGVAPIVPIVRCLTASELGHVITFAYGNRTPDSIILRNEVDELAGFPSVLVEHVLSRAGDEWNGVRGRIDRCYLDARLPRWIARCDLPIAVYLCGPEAFMETAETVLVGFGLDLGQIRRESFDLALNDEDESPPIRVNSVSPGEEAVCESITALVAGEEVKVAPETGESILDALLRVEADVPFSCQEGTCSSCISKLKAGSADVRAIVLKTLRESDLYEGFVLACLSRPVTSHVAIDFDDI